MTKKKLKQCPACGVEFFASQLKNHFDVEHSLHFGGLNLKKFENLMRTQSPIPKKEQTGKSQDYPKKKDKTTECSICFEYIKKRERRPCHTCACIIHKECYNQIIGAKICPLCKGDMDEHKGLPKVYRRHLYKNGFEGYVTIHNEAENQDDFLNRINDEVKNRIQFKKMKKEKLQNLKRIAEWDERHRQK